MRNLKRAFRVPTCHFLGVCCRFRDQSQSLKQAWDRRLTIAIGKDNICVAQFQGSLEANYLACIQMACNGMLLDLFKAPPTTSSVTTAFSPKQVDCLCLWQGLTLAQACRALFFVAKDPLWHRWNSKLRKWTCRKPQVILFDILSHQIPIWIELALITCLVAFQWDSCQSRCFQLANLSRSLAQELLPGWLSTSLLQE